MFASQLISGAFSLIPKFALCLNIIKKCIHAGRAIVDIFSTVVRNIRKELIDMRNNIVNNIKNTLMDIIIVFYQYRKGVMAW